MIYFLLNLILPVLISPSDSVICFCCALSEGLMDLIPSTWKRSGPKQERAGIYLFIPKAGRRRKVNFYFLIARLRQRLQLFWVLQTLTRISWPGSLQYQQYFSNIWAKIMGCFASFVHRKKKKFLKVSYQWNGNHEVFKPCKAYLPNRVFFFAFF